MLLALCNSPKLSERSYANFWEVFSKLYFISCGISSLPESILQQHFKAESSCAKSRGAMDGLLKPSSKTILIYVLILSERWKPEVFTHDWTSNNIDPISLLILHTFPCSHATGTPWSVKETCYLHKIHLVSFGTRLALAKPFYDRSVIFPSLPSCW